MKYKFFITILVSLVGIFCLYSFLHFQFKPTTGSAIKSKTNDKELLHIDFFGEIPQFNPLKPDGLYVWQLQGLVWERLVEIDANQTWHPSLAHSWSFNEDRTELYLKLRPNLKWSDGRAVNFKDFEFSTTFYKIKALKAALFQPLLVRISSVSYSDGLLTLRLNPTKSDDLFYGSSVYWSQILSSLRLLPYNLQKKNYLGTGPYKVQRFSNYNPWFMVPNSKSWIFKDQRAPKLPPEIRIKTYRSETVLAKSLRLKRKSLLLGIDLHQLKLNSYEDWFPFKDKVLTKSLKFNLSKVSFSDRQSLRDRLLSDNDLQKLNLKQQYRAFSPISDIDINKVTGDITHLAKPVKSINLNILYTQSKDSKWLVYLKERYRRSGINLNLILVSNSVFNEHIYNKDFTTFVDDYESDPFYPLYLVFHSKGEYNSTGWNSKEIDTNLEKLVITQDRAKAKLLSQVIFKQLKSNAFEIPLFVYNRSMLWTRNACKPIQKPFQGLGLIYNAVICADNL